MKSLFFSLWKFAKLLMSFKFWINLHCIKHNSSVLFWRKHYILWSKVQIFEILKWSEQISSSCGVNLEQQVNYSPNFASFFIVIIHYSPVNFNPINFLLWIKGCYQSPNFNFKYSVKNFRNYLCHFPNHKSVLHFASLFSVMRHNSCILF